MSKGTNASVEARLPTAEARTDAHVAASVTPILSAALVQLCREKPADPVKWLGEFLLACDPASFPKTRVAQLRAGVLDGQWDVVEGLVDALGFISASHRLAARITVLRQKYLELLEAGQTELALHCLRDQLAPHYHESDRVHASCGHAKPEPSGGACTSSSMQPTMLAGLSSLLLCQSADEVQARAGWEGALGGSREIVLRELSRHIPSSLLLPEDHLQTLLQQALLCQHTQSSATVLNTMLTHRQGPGHSPMLEQQHPGMAHERVPRRTRQVLEQHVDEVWLVWLVHFSHGGGMLASASKDAVVVVWDVAHPVVCPLLTLCGHTDALCALAWSPDDAQLLTCGHDELLRLWALETGECMHAYRKHTESVVACAWLPTGTHFVSAGVDKLVLLWSVDGTLLQVLQGQRVYDLSAVSSVELVAISGREICTYSITYSSEDGLPQLHAPGTTPSMLEDQPITSITLSADSRHALCTVISAEVQEIHLWDLGSGSRIHRYRGHTHGRYVLRACFGGEGECLIVSASEDTQVYIWDRHTEALLEVLPSHSGSVNAVSWCPSRGLLASASDDCTVRLWSAQGALEDQALS
eukprot:jgi/Chrpa1/18795/Chrysochromulina_OHIO_Genome00021727-RA